MIELVSMVDLVNLLVQVCSQNCVHGMMVQMTSVFISCMNSITGQDFFYKVKENNF